MVGRTGVQADWLAAEVAAESLAMMTAQESISRRPLGFIRIGRLLRMAAGDWRVTVAMLRCLAVLASFAKGCFPSHRLVAGHLGVSRQSVQVQLRKKAEVTGSNPVGSAKLFNDLTDIILAEKGRRCAECARYRPVFVRPPFMNIGGDDA